MVPPGGFGISGFTSRRGTLHNHQVRNAVAPLLFHVHPLPMFSFPADDWIVIAKQHCLCALKAL